MQFHTLQCDSQGNWAQPLPRHLDGTKTLVLAFADTAMAAQTQAWASLQQAFGHAIHVGCSTAGQLKDADLVDSGLTAAVVAFEHTVLRAASAPLAEAKQSAPAGRQLALALAQPDLRAVLVLSDGLATNGSELVAALRESVGSQVVVMGGLAGDGTRFGTSWIYDGQAHQAGVVRAVGFYGERLRVGSGCQGGWTEFGPARRITAAQGAVLHRLDERPALDLYKDYLGQLAEGLPGTALLVPMAISRPGHQGSALVRTILSVDETNKTMTFAGDMPLGATAHLMRANSDDLIQSAGRAANQAVQAMDAQSPAFLFSVSCVGRRLVLGERCDEEAEAVVGSVAQHPTHGHIGFYSYGEFAADDQGFADLHNQTMTVAAFCEV